MKNKTKAQIGLTLVELILATAIVSFLGIIIYSTLLQGLKLWHRANSEYPELTVDLFFEKASQDLRNAFIYASLPLRGTKTEMTFFAMIPVQGNGGDSEVLSKRPARVRYFFDKELMIVQREITDYRGALYHKSASPTARTVLQNVTDCEFNYFEPDPKHKNMDWKNRWLDECLPTAVKIRVKYKRSDKKLISRIVPLPSGGCTRK